jgi:GntR family transcriptional repressor for pyruvate dehydrogenase complex
MRAAIQRAEEAHGNSMISGQASLNFHLALAEATHNDVLALMYKTVRDLYLETARQTQMTPESLKDRLHDHRRILECVEQPSPELASKLMAEHIDKGRQFLAGC